MTRYQLTLDPIACDGRGLCADLLPEMVRLDDWGFPMLVATDVPAELESRAKRAASACPMLALRLKATRTPVAVGARRR